MSAKIIGVIGRDFCGSTLLLRLLSSVDGIEGAGELHWLLDIPQGKSVKTRAGWWVSRKCVQCKDKCPVFTKDFLERKIDAGSLYQETARKMNAHVLVVSDKRPHHYDKMAKRGEFDGVVMFKSPMAAVMSDIKREQRSIEESISGYVGLYRSILSWAPNFCRSLVYLSYKDLAGSPLVMTKKLLEEFCVNGEVSQDYSNLNYHHIGGNSEAHKKRKVVIDERWKRGLSNKHKSYIKNHTLCQNVFRELMDKRLRPDI